MPGGVGRHSQAYDPKAVTHEVRTKLLMMRSCEDRTLEPVCPIPDKSMPRSARPVPFNDGLAERPGAGSAWGTNPGACRREPPDPAGFDRVQL